MRTLRQQGNGITELVSRNTVSYTPINDLWTRPSDWVVNDAPTGSQIMTGVVAVYNITTNYVQFAVTGSSPIVNVDWGDGSTSTGVTGTISKTYSYASVTNAVTSQGFKTARIVVTLTSGTLTDLNFNVQNSADVSLLGQNLGTNYFLELKTNTPGASVTTSSSTTAIVGKRFSLLQNLEIGANSDPSWTYAFNFCAALERAVVTIDSSTTNTSWMFNNCVRLYDVTIQGTPSGVTDATGMFFGCSSLRGIQFSGFTNASLITAQMFSGCSSLGYAKLPGAKPIDPSSMFLQCRQLRTLPQIDLSAATNLQSIFNGCSALENMPSISIPAATTTNGMFSNCSNLKTVGRITTSSALTNTGNMFSNCPSLITAPVVTNLLSVTSAGSMFGSCINLRYAPDMTFGAVAAINNLFGGCVSLIRGPSITSTLSLNVSSVFNGCTAMRSCGTLNFGSASNLNSMFSFCTALEVCPSITAAPQTMNGMFQNCYRLRDVSALSSLSFTDAYDGTSMFQNCHTLASIPNIFTSTKMVSISFMFSGCVSLNTVPTITVTERTSLATAAQTNAFLGGSLGSIGNTILFQSTSININRFSASELNTIYTNLPNRNIRNISNAVGNGTRITYTTTADHGFAVGQSVTISSVVPSSYNITGVVSTIPSSTSFTILNSAVGTYSSGGTVVGAALTLTASSNPGYAASTPSIATSKGWTVA